MISKKVLILIIFALSFIFTANSFALVHAVFPNATPLQPLPADIHPNISGNINSTSTYIPTYDYLSDLPSPDSTQSLNTETATTTNQNTASQQKNQPDNWFWFVGLSIV
ncbi:MAG: hypothetical protein WCJ51_04705, partial [Candidatus Moraniibacteriota bacterium]